MEAAIIDGVKQLGALAILMFVLKWLFEFLTERNTRSDEREKELIAVQREMQHLASNHMQHNTEAINRLTDATVANTAASNKIVGTVENCELAQKVRRQNSKE